MSARFEELDFRPTPMGDISLRRRRDPSSGQDVYEVKLDDDFLMSSLFTVAEIELARLGRSEAWGRRELGLLAERFLAEGEIEPLGLMPRSSNRTYLVRIVPGPPGASGVTLYRTS